MVVWGQSTRRIKAVVALSPVVSSGSSLCEGLWVRNREEGREGARWLEEDRAVDLELEVVGPALRWETGCRPGRRESVMASQIT